MSSMGSIGYYMRKSLVISLVFNFKCYRNRPFFHPLYTLRSIKFVPVEHSGQCNQLTPHEITSLLSKFNIIVRENFGHICNKKYNSPLIYFTSYILMKLILSIIIFPLSMILSVIILNIAQN